jgi:DNA-binding transcriptional regulator YdaS (Cro superfamily)
MSSFTQLDEVALALVNRRVGELGTRAAVAAELEISRSGLSQALDGKYPADTRRLRARIVERYAGGVSCPHLGREITPTLCRTWRERPLQSCLASRETVKHWQACQACAENPDRNSKTGGSHD